MNKKDIDDWLKNILPKHNALNQKLIIDLQAQLETSGIKALLVEGRVKEYESIINKINKKRYLEPDEKMTDISGIRIIVYFESDIESVSKIIGRLYAIDNENSLNKHELLDVDQTGYRSVHFVCELDGLKFEIQIRTILQHVWAELAHDRYYKYAGKLPEEYQRRLYLYAGQLEMADKGFDELSIDIDKFIEEDSKLRAVAGWCGHTLNPKIIEKFINKWTVDNSFDLKKPFSKTDYSELLVELLYFKIYHPAQLISIIPADYVKICKHHGYSTDASGLLRDWMLMHDHKRYAEEVSYKWKGFYGEEKIFGKFLSDDKVKEIYKYFHN